MPFFFYGWLVGLVDFIVGWILCFFIHCILLATVNDIHWCTKQYTAMPALKLPENKWLYYATALFIQCGHYWALAMRLSTIEPDWDMTPIRVDRTTWLALSDPFFNFAHLVMLTKDYQYFSFTYEDQWKHGYDIMIFTPNIQDNYLESVFFVSIYAALPLWYLFIYLIYIYLLSVYY